MKELIDDYTMYKLILFHFCNGVGTTIPDSHANGPSSIPSVGIPI